MKRWTIKRLVARAHERGLKVTTITGGIEGHPEMTYHIKGTRYGVVIWPNGDVYATDIPGEIATSMLVREAAHFLKLGEP